MPKLAATVPALIKVLSMGGKLGDRMTTSGGEHQQTLPKRQCSSNVGCGEMMMEKDG